MRAGLLVGCLVTLAFLVARPFGFVPTALAQPPTEKILFIGNSFTFVGYRGTDGLSGAPAIFLVLAHARGHNPAVAMATAGAATLRTHCTNGSNAMTALGSQRWDDVVLQGQSQEATDGASSEGFLYYGDRLSRAIRNRNPSARVMAYETWAFAPGDTVYPAGYRNPDAMLIQIRSHYEALCRLDHATIVRVGEAFRTSELGFGDIPLIGSDFRHPTTAGAYLAALMFYRTIYHEDPRGLPTVEGVSPADATALQAVAASVAR